MFRFFWKRNWQKPTELEIRVLQTQHRNKMSIDSKNQAVLTPCCEMKYRISLALQQWTIYNVQIKKTNPFLFEFNLCPDDYHR